MFSVPYFSYGKAICMKILCIGDVVGSNGLEFLRKVLPDLKRDEKIDVCIVNGENSFDGNGITPQSCKHIYTSGADVITTGNHAYKNRNIYDYFDKDEFLIRPANFPENNPGRGFCVLDKGKVKIGIINMMGTMYLAALDNPFFKMDELLRKEEIRDCKIVIVDFHAEATSEKRAMGFYLDGRVSALFGTHTHVQTSDEQILPGGTGYITDIGMTGPIQSVLGVSPQIIIDKFKYNMPERFNFESGRAFLGGCIFDIDEKTGKTVGVERVLVEE